MLCNFACNSPDCISDLVIESLIFCGFWAGVDSCTGGIACEICESEVFLTSVGLRVGGTVAGRPLCIVTARQNSPGAAGLSRAREKNRPASAKHPKLGAFVSAGRILSRTRPHRPRAGRRMSRLRVPQLGSQTMRRPPRQPRLVASERLPSVISHVIPWRLLQTMNSRRCNCNVCGWSPKVTVGNDVRFLSGLALPPPVGVTRAFCASVCAKVLVALRCAPDREDSTPSDRVESFRSG